jgi:protein associated with RNAse G/E
MIEFKKGLITTECTTRDLAGRDKICFYKGDIINVIDTIEDNGEYIAISSFKLNHAVLFVINKDKIKIIDDDIETNSLTKILKDLIDVHDETYKRPIRV